MNETLFDLIQDKAYELGLTEKELERIAEEYEE